MLREKADQVLVSEDDVAIDWGFVRLMTSQNLAASGINYLKLFNKNITPFKVLAGDFHQRCIIDCRGFAHGMQAYMLTGVGAERFIAICKTIICGDRYSGRLFADIDLHSRLRVILVFRKTITFACPRR
jgi:hypothetical protein